METTGDEGLSDVAAAASVKAKALEIGFDSVGITDLSAPPHAAALSEWLSSGKAGSMAYMQRQAKRRLEPSLILRGATRAVVLTKNYFLPDTNSEDAAAATGKVARYARGTDYHSTIKHRLAQIADLIIELGGNDTVARGYVDAGPVPERELAQRAGIGWIAKNTMLIDPTAGSYFFIASVLTNLDLAIDAPFSFDRCGECTRCIEACPTGAIVAERTLDARLCISFLTIESRDEHPGELKSLMGDLLFGCDICQDVCPWNKKFAQQPDQQWLNQDPRLERIGLREIAELDQGEFDARYGTTPLERPGLVGMKRNARTAMGNLGL